MRKAIQYTVRGVLLAAMLYTILWLAETLGNIATQVFPY